MRIEYTSLPERMAERTAGGSLFHEKGSMDAKDLD